MGQGLVGAPPLVAAALAAGFAEPTEIDGLAVVGRDTIEDPSGVLRNSALQKLVDVHKKLLGASPLLSDLLVARTARRRAVDAAAAALDGPALLSCHLPNGSSIIGYSAETAGVRDDAEWRGSPLPLPEKATRLRVSPTSAESLLTALNSEASLVEADMENCFTGHLKNTVRSAAAIAAAVRGKRDGSCLSLALEGINIGDYHFLYDGEPIASHIVQLVLAAAAAYDEGASSLPFSVTLSYLETKEEAAYAEALLSAVEEAFGFTEVTRCFLEVECMYAAYQMEEMAHVLRSRVAGLGVDNTNFAATVASVHRKAPAFHMDPIAAPWRLEGFAGLHLAVTDLAKRRGIAAFASPCRLQGTDEAVIESVLDHAHAHAEAGFVAFTVNDVAHVATLQAASFGDLEVKKYEKGAQLFVPLSSPPMITRDEFECEIALALQYLASYILGEGRLVVGDTVMTRGSVERIRRELWSLLHNDGHFSLPDGRLVTVDSGVFEQAVDRGIQKMEAEVDCYVPYDIDSKIAYDNAMAVLRTLVTSPAEQSVEFLTEAAGKYTLAPFANDPMTIEVLEKGDEFPFLSMENVALDARVFFSTNDSFASAHNLVKPDFPLFKPKSFGAAGQVYDGWETKRHNMYPPDYVILKLDARAKIHGANFDTAHFHGNHAVGASVEGLVVTEKNYRRKLEWRILVPPTHLRGNARNFAASVNQQAVSIIKVNMYPDGGIGRLQLFGDAVEDDVETAPELLAEEAEKEKMAWIESIPSSPGFPDNFVPPPNSQLDIVPPAKDPPHPDAPLPVLTTSALVDLAGCEGGVVASSSARYSVPSNMLKNGRGFNMGDGWETVRVRCAPDVLFGLSGPVQDKYTWTLIELSQVGTIHTIGLDTLHNKNNSPIAASIEVCNKKDLDGKNYFDKDIEWQTVLSPVSLGPHQEHMFAAVKQVEATHALLKIYPCGGLSRCRLFGVPTASS